MPHGMVHGVYVAGHDPVNHLKKLSAPLSKELDVQINTWNLSSSRLGEMFSIPHYTSASSWFVIQY